MKIKKVHCFFEQSGTFKNAFKRFGIEAEDYDIQNNFGETDNIMNLFNEIEAAYNSERSIFDFIDKQDLIFSFFPCIYFCDYKTLFYRCQAKFQKKWTLEKSCNFNIEESGKRFYYYTMLLKLFAVVDRLGLKMVLENPWNKSQSGYLQNYFIPPTIIDRNRRISGDSFVKPTAYWFVGFKPFLFKTFQYPKEFKTVDKINDKKMKGVCSESRSLISPEYASNFIADHILGIPPKPGLFQQLDLFTTC